MKHTAPLKASKPSTLTNNPGNEGGSVGVDGGIDIEATETVTRTVSIKANPTTLTNNPGNEGGSVG